MDVDIADSLPQLTRTSNAVQHDLYAASLDHHDDDAATIVVHNEAEGVQIAVDIEHMPVADDPRNWSVLRKNLILLLCFFASTVAGLAANIQTPGIEEMEADLPATSSQISLSISLFILFQGLVPLLWSAISEVKGRKVLVFLCSVRDIADKPYFYLKIVYLISLAIFTVASIIVATSRTIGMVIGFRCLQAAGSSAVTSLGGATLADIYDPEQRGTKIGIYYISLLLGPSIGALLGGALTDAFSWRAIFYFLAILSGIVLLAFQCFQDTFRHERSSAYQAILKRRLAEHVTSKKLPSKEDVAPRGAVVIQQTPETDVEKQVVSQAQVVNVASDIKLSLMDVNPVKPMIAVIIRRYNYTILIASGILFAFSFLIMYTTSRTLGTFYHYEPLSIGLVLVCYGVGNVFGSFLGGRWSDYQMARLTKQNGGKKSPEMRLQGTLLGLFMMPLCIVAYGWIIQQRLHIAAVCVILLACGFFVIFVYTSTLAYLVDSNVGRSSTAIALNSAFRGTFAFIVTEDDLGDGWMYTIMAGLVAISGLLIVLVMCKGAEWRVSAEQREIRKQLEANEKH
ncbi:hypothetical protein D9758_007097 [Tetrapyrgos nigripes]|uniref:Major facilitator superfamily (MFS) profile domain-containing protein n=1 Tax=Tetrapyrgos nigripes TaxID=182062 RepID=A0A8H5LMT7_9AGAR|nr:hypothetical protein D9758_007097 [Tetrapyrgos nigripes]